MKAMHTIKMHLKGCSETINKSKLWHSLSRIWCCTKTKQAAASACLCNFVLVPQSKRYIQWRCTWNAAVKPLVRFGSVPKLNRLGYGLPTHGTLNCCSFAFSHVSDLFFPPLLHEYSFQPPAGGLWMIKTLLLVILLTVDQAYEISLSEQRVYYLPHSHRAWLCKLP